MPNSHHTDEKVTFPFQRGFWHPSWRISLPLAKSFPVQRLLIYLQVMVTEQTPLPQVDRLRMGDKTPFTGISMQGMAWLCNL